MLAPVQFTTCGKCGRLVHLLLTEEGPVCPVCMKEEVNARKHPYWE